MSVTLTYSTTTLVLPDPSYGNTERVEMNSSQKQTRHGDAIIYHDSTWPVLTYMAMTFINLNDTLRQELKSFLTLVAGRQISITDHNGDNWSGYITTPEVEIITVEDLCLYDARLEFLVEIE